MSACRLPGTSVVTPTHVVLSPSPLPQIVYEMEQAGVEPTAYTYTLLLDCLAQRSKAFDGFQVSKLSYHCSLCACQDKTPVDMRLHSVFLLMEISRWRYVFFSVLRVLRIVLLYNVYPAVWDSVMKGGGRRRRPCWPVRAHVVE